MKILLNTSHSCFQYSDNFIDYLRSKNIKVTYDNADQTLIQAIEEFGVDKVCKYKYNKIRIEEIPDGVKYKIKDYDNAESIGLKWIEVTEEELRVGLTYDQIKMLEFVDCIKLKK